MSRDRATTRGRAAPAVAASAEAHDDDIAVVGIACRLPGAPDYATYWRNLVERRFSVGEVPADRWSIAEHYSPDPDAKSKSISKWGGFIEGADHFDAAFFKVSPREAELMDPQQRIMLELTWSCIEDAGYAPSQLRGSSAGVFIGACNFDYKEKLEKIHAPIEGHLSTGTYTTLIPNRVSYEFDFKGPSISIDSACASSLVALHDAVYALRRGDCQVAFAGGVSVLCSPTYFIAFSKLGMLSPEGVCKTFDADASGYVRGEGAGLVMLKPLRRALADGDRIYARVIATGVNHGGKVATLTSPSPYAQSKLIVDAYQQAGIAPDTVSYIEAHGTGTPKGDPIEVIGLKRAFATLQKSFGVELAPGTCGIGSAKTNIGHLEAAAGIAGLIKVLLSIKHRTLPGLLHLANVNPRVDFSDSPFYLVDSTREWTTPDDRPRRAGVSSFGFGGVNAHAVLEEYVQAAPEPFVAARPLAFVLSARNAERLRAYARLLLDDLATRDDAAFGAIVRTLQRRQAMDERVVAPVRDLAELRQVLDGIARGATLPGFVRGNVADSRDALKAALADTARKQAFDDALARGEIDAVAALWTLGQAVDWDYVFGVDRAALPPTIALPTYPFAQKRYWLEGPAVAATPAAAVERPATWEVAEDWRALSPAGGTVRAAPLVVAHLDTASLAAVRDAAPDATLVALAPPDDVDGMRGWIDAYWASLDAIKTALKRQPGCCVLVSGSRDPYAATIYGALLAIGKELDLPVQWYRCDDASAAREAIAVAAARPRSSGVRRFLDGVWQERVWRCDARPVLAPPAQGEPRFAQGGVYWITGGNGGIGRKIADYLAREFGAHVVVSGRSEAAFDAVPVASGAVYYRRADCTSTAQMRAVCDGIVAQFGRLDGVIHAAGAIQDKSVFFKTRKDVDAVMRPKVDGAFVLDEVTRDLDLDFFALFSSISGVFGNPGQTDYAAANAFLGAFGARRAQRVDAGERRGDTVTIHWPYWEAGGMRLTGDLVAALETSLGTTPLPDADALAQFEAVIRSGRRDVCLMYGTRPALLAALNGVEPAPAAVAVPVAAPPRDRAAAQERLRDVLAELTRIDTDEIRADANFSDYGVDSILLQEMLRRVNREFGVALTAVQMHKFSTLAGLAGLIVPHDEPAAVAVSPQPAVPGAGDDIAIVGLSLKLPGVESLADLWRVLDVGDFAVQEYPASRWASLPPDMTRGHRREDCPGLFLDPVDGFDHQLFKVSPREAMLMDPQQRLLLQTVWRAIENAGYTREEFARRRTSVLLSIGTVDYEDVVRHDPRVDEFSASGVSRYIAANRLSHYFDLAGMSEPVDTACSSFFVALDRAIDSLRKGLAEQAVVAATQLNLSPRRFALLREKGILSRQGRTLPFDERADGFVRSEGLGAVIVKPLALALADGDHVYAVVKSVGVWHGGKSLGMTAPNAGAHHAAMTQAIAASGVGVDAIGYVEAHGTGMNLGDASEADAIVRTFADLGRRPDHDCVLSASKSVLGHLEAASGVAALAKAVLALRERRVPGIAGYAVANRQAPLAGLRVSAATQPLPDGTRCAGLNSYGLGGVSAFVVLEGRDAPTAATNAAEPGVFVLSAHNERTLDRYLARLSAFLRTAPRDYAFGDLLANYQRRREMMAHRVAIVASDADDLAARIDAFRRGEAVDGVHATRQGCAKEIVERSLLDGWVEAGEWGAIGRAWVGGSVVPWPDGGEPRRPFPEYPFDNDRAFWVGRNAEEAAPAPPQQHVMLSV